MLTSEVLNLAADRLQVDGWWHPTWTWDRDNPQPRPICVGNAIWYVTGQNERAATPARGALLAHINGLTISDIFEWNDAPERTAEEVIATLRATALIEAAREEQDAAEATYAENLAVAS